MSGVWSLTITHAALAHNTTHRRLKHVLCYSMTTPDWRVTDAVELASSGKDKTGQHEGWRRGSCTAGITRSKHDGTRAETRFGLSAKRMSPFKSAGVSVQSTAGSRGVRISGQQLYRPCSDVQCKTTGYPLHSHLSPSLPLPCVTVCHQVLNALYEYKPKRITGPALVYCARQFERPSLSRRSVLVYLVVICVHKMMTPCAVVIRDPFNTPKSLLTIQSRKRNHWFTNHS